MCAWFTPPKQSVLPCNQNLNIRESPCSARAGHIPDFNLTLAPIRMDEMLAASDRASAQLSVSPQEVRLVFTLFGKFHDLRHLRGVRIPLHSSCSSVIHRFFEADKRLGHLARQDEADPYAKHESDR